MTTARGMAATLAATPSACPLRQQDSPKGEDNNRPLADGPLMGRPAVGRRAGSSWQGRQNANLTQGVPRQADGGVTVSSYRKGQALFAQGDPAESILYIQQGKIKISGVSEPGKEAVVAFLEAGDFIDEGCLGRLRWSAMVTGFPAIEPLQYM